MMINSESLTVGEEAPELTATLEDFKAARPNDPNHLAVRFWNNLKKAQSYYDDTVERLQSPRLSRDDRETAEFYEKQYSMFNGLFINPEEASINRLSALMASDQLTSWGGIGNESYGLAFNVILSKTMSDGQPNLEAYHAAEGKV